MCPDPPDPLSDSREQLLDALLLGGRLHQVAPVGVSLPQVALVGSLHLGEFTVDGDLDASMRMVHRQREKQPRFLKIVTPAALSLLQWLVSVVYFGLPCSTFSVLDVITPPALSVATSSRV